MLYLCGKLRKDDEKERRDHHDKEKDRRKISVDETEIERALLLKRQRSLSVPKSATAHLVFDEKGDLACVQRTLSGRLMRGISPTDDDHGASSSGSPGRRSKLSGEHESKAGHQHQLQRRRSSLKRRSSNATLLPKKSLTDSIHSQEQLVMLARSESSSRRHSRQSESEAGGIATHADRQDRSEVPGGDISL